MKAFPAEISDLMVKCFSQLSVQTPIMASMLALIHPHEPEFTALVADKLQTRYLQAVAQDEVVVAKLLLRAVTCLAGALTFAVEGNGGLVEILTPLLTGLTQGTHHFPNSDICAQLANVLPIFLSFSLSPIQQSWLRTQTTPRLFDSQNLRRRRRTCSPAHLSGLPRCCRVRARTPFCRVPGQRWSRSRLST